MTHHSSPAAVPKTVALGFSLVTMFLVFMTSLPVTLAQTQINSGGVQDLTSQTGAVAISNNTRLNVLSGGIVQSISSTSDVVGARIADTSILSLSTGGEIRAITSNPGSATAVIASGNSLFEFTGGTIGAATDAVPSNNVPLIVPELPVTWPNGRLNDEPSKTIVA